MKKQKSFWLCLLCVGITFNCIAQSSGELKIKNEKNETEIHFNRVDDVVFTYHKGICIDSDALFLKIENHSGKHVDVTYSLWETMELRTITLKPEQVRKAECSSAGDFLLVVTLQPGQSEENFSPTIIISPKN